MTMRTRKLVGSFVLFFGLLAYLFFAAGIGSVMLHGKPLLQVIYYPIAGIIWIFPVRGLMVWMNKPD